MAHAFDTYSGNGSQTDFNITFPYINEDHVKVYVNYVNTSFTFEPNKSTVRLASAPASGVAVEVRRITPLTAVLVDYADGSTLTAGDLDTSNLQHLYNDQELDDIQNKAVALSPTTGLPTANNRKITEVADPTAAQDAATKNYVDTTTQPVDAELTELATMSSGTAAALADLTAAEVQAIDGITSSTNELNILDGVTASTAELNYVDGVTSNVQTQLNAKQPLDAELTELATMASDTASSLADLTAAEVQAIDGITASTSELNILDGVTASTAEINKLDDVTASTAEINYLDGVTSAIQTQLNAKQPLDAELTELATMASTTADALADLTNAEVTILDGATLTTTELNYVDGVTSSVQTQLDAKQPLDSDLTTLAGMQSGTASILAGGTALTATLTELNQVDGKTIGETTLTANSDTKIPTSKAVNDRILTVTNALGGFVAIANETSFPATHPDPSDGAGTVVSISDAGDVVVNGSGVATISNGAGSGNTVTINGFPSSLQSKTLAAGIGLQVQTTTTLHTYDYHKILAKEADVEQLSNDIDDFKARYRTGSNNPTSDNDAGDLFFNTGTDKMYVRNAANNAWDEVQSIGNFYLQALSGFNGSLNDFTIANPPSNAHQIILSINGVIQKPNAGTSRPSEGFALDGTTLKLSDAPNSGDTNFYIIMGSSVNIGTPSNNTVTEAILQNNIVSEDKLKASNNPTNGQFLSAQSGNTGGLTWAAVPAGVGGATGLDLNDDVKIRLGTDNDAEIYYNNANDRVDFVFGSGKWHSVSGDWSIGGTLNLRNTDTTWGTSSTAELMMGYQHAGNGSRISNTHTGGLKIWSDLGKITKQSNTDFEYIVWNDGTSVDLYYADAKKFETSNTGVTVTGTVAATAYTGDGSALTGISSVGGATGVDFNDDVKARWGTGNDLEIYFSGTDSFIEHEPTSGSLVLWNNSSSPLFLDSDIVQFRNKARNETLFKSTNGGGVELYYDNTKKFQTEGGNGAARIYGQTIIRAAADNKDIATFTDDGSDSACNLYYNGVKKLETMTDRVKVHDKFECTNQLITHNEFDMLTNGNKYIDTAHNTLYFRRVAGADTGHSTHCNISYGGVWSADFNDTSDEKLKKNIATITDGAISKVKQLRPVTFDWIDTDHGSNVSGFVAQEVKTVLPNLVYGTEYDSTLQNPEKGTKGGIKSEGYSINTVGIVAHLTKALQEAITKIETLETKVAALEAG